MEDQRMRITALVKSHDHVCCRYRVAAFRPYWESLGHEVEIQPWSSGWFLQRILGLSRRTDVLLVQRKLFPLWQLKLLRGAVNRLVYDFDDSIFLNSSYNPLGRECPKRFQQFRNLVRAADVVVAGNEYLRDQAAAITDPAKVRLIPTCVDAARYSLARHDSTDGAVRLVWIGSSSTLRGLEKFRATLNRLGQTLPAVRFKVICDRSLSLEHLPVDFRPWSESTEAADLADADIGISWLPDDAWSAGKCGLKVLQYMSAGLPVVANPVGLQRTLVRDGETGFLARTPEEWQNAVARLARDPHLRRAMGAAGRRCVENEYDIAQGRAAWAEIAVDWSPARAETSSSAVL